MEILEQFYRKTVDERRKILNEMVPNLSENGAYKLKNSIGDSMIENYYDSYCLPLGLATNFKINGQIYHIPMANEEPSVIAAASNGAKKLGNITTTTKPKEIIGQIVLTEIKNIKKAQTILEKNSDFLLEQAKLYSTSMVNRGGGPTRIWTNLFEEFLTIYIGFNPCDAMGANAINSLLEKLSDEVEKLVEAHSLMRILSNYQEESLTIAQSFVPIQTLSNNLVEAKAIAQRVVEAHRYAQLDVYRATTNNKGILNGIGAVLIATGNDWRAVDAGLHAYACKSGSYQPLANWWIEGEYLIGKLEVPLSVATVGGTIGVHPEAQNSLKILGNPSSTHLAEIIAAVGLAQNFAAIRAIVTEGIQKGHMGLHAKQLSLQVGAKDNEKDELIRRLKEQKNITISVAETILNEMRNQK